MGGCFTPSHGVAGHIPEQLVQPSVLHIDLAAQGRKDKSTAFDGSPFNGRQARGTQNKSKTNPKQIQNKSKREIQKKNP